MPQIDALIFSLHSECLIFSVHNTKNQDKKNTQKTERRRPERDSEVHQRLTWPHRGKLREGLRESLSSDLKAGRIECNVAK